MKLTFKSALITMGVIVMSTLAGAVAANLYGTSTGVRLAEAQSAARGVLQVLEGAKISALDVLLTSMDIIVDRDEGEVPQERLDRLTEDFSVLAETLRNLETSIDDAAALEKIKSVSAQVPALQNVARQELVSAVEKRADESAFADLDDRIDGAGDTILGELNEISRIVGADIDEIHKGALRRLEFVKLATGAFFLLAIGGTLLALLALARFILRPVMRLKAHLNLMAEANYAVAAPDTGRKDEMGSMARAIEKLRSALVSGEEARVLREDEKVRAEGKRRGELLELAQTLEQSVGGALALLVKETGGLENAAGTMSRTASSTREQASASSQSSGEACAQIQMVASASEQLAASIKEISRRTEASLAVVSKVTGDVARTNEQLSTLAESARRINAVTDLIMGIATETNLLALNATIEAARAGEAGKGFTVVAHEVKELASQTARSTDEVRAQIDQLQRETSAVTDALKFITKSVGTVQEDAQSIGAISEQQAAATREIAGAADNAVRYSGTSMQQIEAVREAADSTGDNALKVLESAQVLTQHTDTIRSELVKFLQLLRAA